MAYLIYDGDCPFCSRYAEFARIRQAVPDLELVDARAQRDHPAVQAAGKAGLVLDEGMALVTAERIFYGAEALAALAEPASFLSDARRAAKVYPFLRLGRNLALKALGRRKLGY